MTTRDACLARDAADPLSPLRAQFSLDALDAAGIVYLDGNSLGVLPRAAAARVREVVDTEWGQGLVRSWNAAGWMDLPRRVGDRIAALIGAGPGEVIVADSTSVNLYKILTAAAAVAAADGPGRRRLVSERGNFPGDLYVAGAVARTHGLELALADPDGIPAHLDASASIVLLTHVDYRTGRMHDMARMTRSAHEAGALVVWDLAHSAGAMPIDLEAGGAIRDAADFAVGCGYKYLNGGPGAPAFAWIHPRHAARLDQEGWRPPLSGWMGHRAPFDFRTDYEPAAGIARFLCGTPPILSLAALECGVDTVRAADRLGGLEALRLKSIALSSLFIALVESRCAGHGLTLVSPRDAGARGSHVSFSHPADGYAVMQALIARGVIGDFRAPDLLRFGFTPLYTRFVDVWDAVDRLAATLDSGEWREPRFAIRGVVT